jgi:LysM repeat protein
VQESRSPEKTDLLRSLLREKTAAKNKNQTSMKGRDYAPKKMNSPLIPQGSNVEQQDKARSSLKTKIFVALGVNVVVLLGLLLTPGCKREQPVAELPPEPTYTDTNSVAPVIDTNVTATVTDTNVVSTSPTTIVEPPPLTQPVAAVSEYEIQKGDTFSSIAPKFHISVSALKAANPTVDPAKLRIGKKINIPAAATTSVAPPSGGGPIVDVVSGMTTYAVKSGDTLSKLATEFHTTVKAIQSANGLSDTKIKVGQSLKIPTKQ